MVALRVLVYMHMHAVRADLPHSSQIRDSDASLVYLKLSSQVWTQI